MLSADVAGVERGAAATSDPPSPDAASADTLRTTPCVRSELSESPELKDGDGARM